MSMLRVHVYAVFSVSIHVFMSKLSMDMGTDRDKDTAMDTISVMDTDRN
jgi:hypothetical protein